MATKPEVVRSSAIELGQLETTTRETVLFFWRPEKVMLGEMPDGRFAAWIDKIESVGFGQSEDEAKRALGDAVHKLYLHWRCTPPWTDEEERLSCWLINRIDPIASGFMAPTESTHVFGWAEMLNGQPVLRHNKENYFDPLPLTAEQFQAISAAQTEILVGSGKVGVLVKIVFDTSIKPPREFVNPQIAEWRQFSPR